MIDKKKALAIIIPGGIGTGHNNIGVPVLERIVKLLSNDFSITVFSLFRINDTYKQSDFELISISGQNFFWKSLKFVSVFIREHRQKQFECIHGFWAMPSGCLAVLMGKIFRIKSLVSILGGDAIYLPEINYGQLRRRFPRKLIMWTLTNADEVISLTQYLANNLKVFGLSRNVKIIPWGIDTAVFRFHDKPIGDPIQFLHIANLTPVKDQTTLLKAFKIISDQVRAVLTIIGEGILEAQVKSLVAELKLQQQVTFLGLLPYDDLPLHYQRADILLHTSLSEGQSEVVTEAMCSGVVVCGTSVGLIYDQQTCCIAVPVKDFQALGSEVLGLVTDPQRMQRIRHNARAWTSDHSIHWTVKKMKELYA